MANMNIKTEKILSPSNIRRIIMLGISIRDQLENAEKGLISDYDSTQTYTRGQAVYYDNYLYKCLYTTTGTWDSTKWQKIGDELDLITKADIEAMLGLTQEEIASLQSLISTEIRLDKCFSSSDTYNRILNAENECKKFTLEQLAKKAGVVYKVVADTTGVDSTEFLYLISNGSNGYNIYAYIDGSAVKISDTNINLDGYAKLTDLNNYLKTTDAEGKYALITTVDNHINDTTAHPTDSHIKDVVGLSSDNANLVIRRYNENEGGQLDIEVGSNSDLDKSVAIDVYGNTLRFFEDGGNYRGASLDISKLGTGVSSNICTTKVTDVLETKITLSDTTNYKINDVNIMHYTIKNGICYFNIGINCVTPSNDFVYITNLPKSSMIFLNSINPWIAEGDLLCYKVSSTGFGIKKGKKGVSYLFSGSYPVAE